MRAHEQSMELKSWMIWLLKPGVLTGFIVATIMATISMVAVAQTTEPAIESAPTATKPAVSNASQMDSENSMDNNTSMQKALPAGPAIPATVEAKIQSRFNELRHELLDDRADNVYWWLVAITIVLGFLAIVSVVIGYMGFGRFREIETEARQHVTASKQHAEEARNIVEAIKVKGHEAESLLEKLNAEVVRNNPKEASEAAENVRSNPLASLINQAIADAVLFQRRGEIKKAIKKWRAVADVAEESDTDLAVRAWFSVGYLILNESPEDSIAANDRVIRLKPDYVAAYLNRGFAKAALGQHNDAIADYDEAIRLRPDYVAAYVNRGNENAALGQYNDAIADYDRAIHLETDNVEAYSNRGLAKNALGLKNEARKDFKMALELAQSANNTTIMAQAEQELRNLATDEGS